MKKQIIIISVILACAGIICLSGCSRGDNPRPKDDRFIVEEKMVRILADLEITEAALKMHQTKISNDSMTILAKRAYDSLFYYYDITPDQFKENLFYYQQDLENYQKMMDEKINILTRKRDSINFGPEKLDIKKIDLDSLKK